MSQLSKLTPQEIRGALSGFDAHIRGAVYSGDLGVVEKKEKEIKFFYKFCMRLTDPELVAAFNRKFFLHGFMRDYRKNKDSPTFIEDQREKMRKYDSRVWASSLVNAEKSSVVVPASNAHADLHEKLPRTHHEPNMAQISETVQSYVPYTAANAKSLSVAAVPAATDVSTRILHNAQPIQQDSHNTAEKSISQSIAATPQSIEVSTRTLQNTQPHKRDSHISLSRTSNSNPVNLTAATVPTAAPKVAAVFPNRLNPIVTTGLSNPAISYSSSSGKKISNFVNAAASMKESTAASYIKPPITERPISQGPIKIGPPVLKQQSRTVSKLSLPDDTAPRHIPKPITNGEAGPGPRTMANYKGIIRRPIGDGVIRRPVDETRPIGQDDFDLLQKIDDEDAMWRKFQEIEDEPSDSDYHPPTDDLNESIGNGKRKRDASDNEMISTADERPRTKGKGKEKQVHYEDDIDVLHKDKSIHYRPRQPSQPADRPKPISTGVYHPTKCSHCRLSDRLCEKQQSGGACVSCRRFKHKCEYSRARKELKSKPFVESEDDYLDPLEPTGTPEPRHPRLASAAARRAIKKVSVTERPPTKKARTKSELKSEQLSLRPAVLDEEVMKKLDAIVTHLSDMAGYLKRIVEVGEANYEMGDANPEGLEMHSTPPLSETSPRESPTLENSPLTSPSPSPRTYEISDRPQTSRDFISLTIPAAPSAATLDIDMLPPPSPPRPRITPNVNLIQPTPESSQTRVPVTRLHPTPDRGLLDSTSDASPAVVQSSPLAQVSYSEPTRPVEHVISRPLVSTSSTSPAASPLSPLSPLSPSVPSESQVLPSHSRSLFASTPLMSSTAAQLSPLSLLPFSPAARDDCALIPPISIMNDQGECSTNDGLPAVNAMTADQEDSSTSVGLPAGPLVTAEVGLPAEHDVTPGPFSLPVLSRGVDDSEVPIAGNRIPSDSYTQISPAAAQLSPSTSLASEAVIPHPGTNIVPATDGPIASTSDPLPASTSEILSAVDQCNYSALTIDDIISMPERMDAERNALLNVPDPTSEPPAARTRSRSHTPISLGPASRTRSRSRSPLHGVKRKSDATQDDNAPNKRPK